MRLTHRDTLDKKFVLKKMQQLFYDLDMHSDLPKSVPATAGKPFQSKINPFGMEIKRVTFVW